MFKLQIAFMSDKTLPKWCIAGMIMLACPNWCNTGTTKCSILIGTTFPVSDGNLGHKLVIILSLFGEVLGRLVVESSGTKIGSGTLLTWFATMDLLEIGSVSVFTKVLCFLWFYTHFLWSVIKWKNFCNDNIKLCYYINN